MSGDFTAWLAENGLSEAFTTTAGDSFYVNFEKKFGVIRKKGEYGAHSFYLDDIVAFKTCDDEKTIAEWDTSSNWNAYERSTRHSTNEIYTNLRFRDGKKLKLQIFKAENGNIERKSSDHEALYNYACQVSNYIYSCAKM